MKHLLTLLLFISTSVMAEQIGSWTLDEFPRAAEIYTTNEDSVIGFVCHISACISYLNNVDTHCVEGDKNAYLFNGSKSIYSETECVIWEGRYVNRILNENIVLMLEDSLEIQVAVPLADGSFKINKYSVDGFREAVKRVLKFSDVEA